MEAVRSAASRGCDTYLVCDRSQASGKTKQQLQVLKELRSVGTKVKLASGLGVNQAYRSDGRSVRVGSRLQGLHHAKSVMIWCHPGDKVEMLVGSCNFTTSSKANKEASIGISVNSGTELVRRWESAFEEALKMVRISTSSRQSKASTGAGSAQPVQLLKFNKGKIEIWCSIASHFQSASRWCLRLATLRGGPHLKGWLCTWLNPAEGRV